VEQQTQSPTLVFKRLIDIMNIYNFKLMGMSYQVEELAVPTLVHVVGSGITVDCGIMYVPNGWWKHRWTAS
jgi:hypothetical protein